MNDQLFDTSPFTVARPQKPVPVKPERPAKAPARAQAPPKPTRVPKDRKKAQEAAREAIQRVGEHANPLWKERALEAVWKAARIFPEFTTEDVWPLLPDDCRTHDGRAMGSVMLKAKSLGYVVETDRFVKSGSLVNHGRPQRVWSSRLRGKKA